MYTEAGEPNVHVKYLKCGHEWWLHSPGVTDPAGILSKQPKCPTDGKIYVEDFDLCLNCKGKHA